MLNPLMNVKNWIKSVLIEILEHSEITVNKNGEATIKFKKELA